jgi:glutamate synthase (NADPH/NADH) small chain
MRESGISFVNKTEVGADIAGGDLLKEYDSVVLCCGATKPRDLQVPGRELDGIHFAVEYLSDSTKSVEGGGEPEITAKGKDVVVIGGGDTGNDCVATAIRQGCASVRQLEIMPCPPAERAFENPWPEYPGVLKTDYGQKECIALFGKDPREYCVSTLGFKGDEEKKVAGIATVEVEWTKDRNGRFIPAEVEGSKKHDKTQLVLLAMGFTGPERNLQDEFGIDIKRDDKTYEGCHATRIGKLFIAGDMRIGQSLVVRAIKEGRHAAEECDGFLMG